MSDDLEGVLNRVPANLPAVPWAAPEEIRQRGRSRQRRRMLSATFAGVLVVSLGVVVAFQPNWLGTAGGSVVAGADGGTGGPVPSSVATLPPTAVPDTPATSWDTAKPPRANASDPAKVAPTVEIPASALLPAEDLPGGDYQLYDTIVAGSARATGPTAVLPGAADWIFARQDCPAYRKSPPQAYRQREAMRFHTYLNPRRVMVDQTVERYPDAASAKRVMGDIRRVAMVDCETYGRPKDMGQAFVGEDSARYLFVVAGVADSGTYWTVVRQGNLVSVLRTPDFDDTDPMLILEILSKEMAARLCASDGATPDGKGTADGKGGC